MYHNSDVTNINDFGLQISMVCTLFLLLVKLCKQMYHFYDSNGNYCFLFRMIVGTEEEAFPGDATVELRGNKFTKGLVMADGPAVGAMALGTLLTITIREIRYTNGLSIT